MHGPRLVLLLLLIACKGDAPSPAPTAPPPISPAPAKRGATVRVDRRVELVSIVQRLAGGSEYTQAPATSPYVVAVDRWFAPFKDHAAVTDAIQDRKTYGVSFDAPMVLAVHLDGALALRNPDEIAAMDKRWLPIDVELRAQHLREFAAAARLDEFLASQAAHIAAVEAELRAVVEREDPVAWFDRVFGPAAATFTVVPGLLTGRRNFGPHMTLPDGTQELYQVLAATGADGSIEPTDELVRLLVHEMAHSYINPVFAKHRAALAPPATVIYKLVAEQMAAQHYKDPLTMVDESVVRATVVRYVTETKGDAAGAAAKRAELRQSFLWIGELADVMLQFETGKTRDLAAFVPTVTALFTKLAADYTAHGLPPTPFVGPINAVLDAPVFVAPASAWPNATAYPAHIRDLLFPASPVVTASPKTLAEHPGKHLVAYGTPATSALIADVAARAGWKLEPEGITVGTRTFAGKDLALIACWPRPDDPMHGVLVYAATNEQTLIAVNNVRHGGEDWLVVRRKVPSATYEVVASGTW